MFLARFTLCAYFSHLTLSEVSDPVTGETPLSRPQRRIINGESVDDIKDYPFMVLLLFLDTRKSVRKLDAHTCGGTILSQTHILTAAHCLPHCGKHKCVYDSHLKARVFAGSSVANSALQVIEVKETYEHPKYKELDGQEMCVYNYDIGVLVLKKKLKLGTRIGTTTLPEPGRDDHALHTGKNCTVLGWGDMEERRAYSWNFYVRTAYGTFSKHLQKSTVPLMPITTCIEYISALNVSLREAVVCEDTQFCSSDPLNKTGVCFGDSGGAIVCDGKQVGIISYTVEKCVGPNIYTRTDINAYWIKQVMTSKATEVSFSTVLFVFHFCLFLCFILS